MKFDLAAMVRRTRNPRRAQIPMRDIRPPATLATSLFRRFYLPVIQRWQAALPRIVEIYAQNLSRLTQDAPSDLESELASVTQEINRLILILEPDMRSWAIAVEKWHRGKWVGSVLSASGVDLQTMLGPEDTRDTVDATIAWNTSLIKDVSTQARQRIANAVFTGLTERKPAREVAKEIQGAVDMGRTRAIGIAADQLSKISSSLDAERMRQAGISRFRYVHSAKRHPRLWHLARNGKTYDMETLKQVGGPDVIAPDDQPGQPPWCSCRRAPIIEFD